ncbi:hypothetical protein KSP40_PGU018016 [Platanthera guangdongensis]|uniref:DUF3741 domain-containing protein n=1 Tax=Platanthera guangdongensis TaxID=2320717 RepID=A0ABR2N0D9_9ASPA
METRERSELQLLRISREAHELAHMIDSWSKTPTRGDESVHIANMLLSGSLELQDSLQILSKLQKDSCRMSDKNMKQRVKEEDAGDQIFKGRRSKSNKIWLQKAGVTVDGCSTNSMEVMKKVIRDRLCMQSLLPMKSDDKNVLFIKTSVSSQVKKMEVPSLIAKLMGLEDFPSEILKRDYLERPETQIGVQRTIFDEDDQVPPVNFSPRSGEDFNLVTEMRSKREKITLAELILKDKSSGHNYFPSNTSELKRNVKPNTGKIQELNTGISESQQQQQQQQEKKVIMESKMIQENKFVELKEVKTIVAPADTVFHRSMESDKRKIAANVSLQTDKSLKQNKEIYSPKSMALNSNCSLNWEKTSREKPVRRFKMAAKAIRQAYLRNPYGLDGACGETTNDWGIIEQDRGISRLIEQSQDIFKSKHVCSQKIDIQCQSKSSEEFEAVGDQLLLDYSRDALTHESHEKFSNTKMPGPDVRKRSKSLSIGHFSEEVSNFKENLSSSSKIGDDATCKNRLYILLENDLRCNGIRFNSSWDDGWNNGFSGEEVDQIAVQMVEQIIARVLMEVAMDLVEFV